MSKQTELHGQHLETLKHTRLRHPIPQPRCSGQSGKRSPNIRQDFVRIGLLKRLWYCLCGLPNRI